MKTRKWIAFVVMLGGWAYASAQEKQPAVDPQRVEVSLYEAGKVASFPELLPADLSSLMADKCDKSASGEVELTFIVDADGHPRNVMFIHAIGNDLDRLAVVLARANRFKPAMLNGSVVAVDLTDTIKLTGCTATEKNALGQEVHSLRFHSQPEQHLKALKGVPEKAVFALGSIAQVRHDPAGPGLKDPKLKMPVAIFTVDPSYTQQAKDKNIDSTIMLEITVSAEGLPGDIKIARPVGYGMDEQSIEAVLRYRFKPATYDGMPVPAIMKIAIFFHSR
ncbi:energy transducer TonB [Terracidiphilus gabretensis]|uniref:energy transducer TonB n=1 Tax=Terracidiphilus gabretensis TaxID=1577687 RepID=UPI00071C000B|nr:TonB family protein [Terracidiphilus gabretensis]